ncbi:MAG: Gfo/Idh/MocA family oxidoreductase [Planctomycetaceae bacterium]|nr:Gfo/Idh/MocA family oxidoreductase [Planctomycetaceae bacterium]
MDIGIYALQAARYLTGEEPVEVTAISYATPNDPRFKEVEETVEFDLRFESGAVGSCLSSYGFGCNRFRVYGTRGQIQSEPFLSYQGNRLWQGEDRQGDGLAIKQGNHFALEMDHFAQCVLNDEAPKTPGEEGLRDVKSISAIYEASESGTAVKIA